MHSLCDSTRESVIFHSVDSSGKLLKTRRWKSQRKVKEELIDQAYDFIRDSGITAEQLQGFFILIGPGSYTNLRVTCSFVNVLAYLYNTPLYGISILDLLIYQHALSESTSQSAKIVLNTQYGILQENYIISKNLEGNKSITTYRGSKNSEDEDALIERSVDDAGFAEETERLFPAFVSEAIRSKTIDISKLCPAQKMLFPLYNAPPKITKRASSTP